MELEPTEEKTYSHVIRSLTFDVLTIRRALVTGTISKATPKIWSDHNKKTEPKKGYDLDGQCRKCTGKTTRPSLLLPRISIEPLHCQATDQMEEKRAKKMNIAERVRENNSAARDPDAVL